MARSAFAPRPPENLSARVLAVAELMALLRELGAGRLPAGAAPPPCAPDVCSIDDPLLRAHVRSVARARASR